MVSKAACISPSALLSETKKEPCKTATLKVAAL
jgi:hypothetical protein